MNEIPTLAEELARFARLVTTEPRAAMLRLERGAGALRAAVVFRGCVRGRRVNAGGPVRVVAEGRISLGDRVQFAGGIIPTELVARAGAELVVGEACNFNYGVSLDATARVRIGARCLFGSMVRVRDAAGTRVAPVEIGDDVWLAHGARVEPGVTIGAGSVVSAGSVVTADVPPRSLALGNPATCVPLGAVARTGGVRR